MTTGILFLILIALVLILIVMTRNPRTDGRDLLLEQILSEMEERREKRCGKYGER